MAVAKSGRVIGHLIPKEAVPHLFLECLHDVAEPTCNAMTYVVMLHLNYTADILFVTFTPHCLPMNHLHNKIFNQHLLLLLL